MHVRAGKFGDDKVFITYMETTSANTALGNVPKGTIPNFFLIDVPNRKKLKSDVKLTKQINKYIVIKII